MLTVGPRSASCTFVRTATRPRRSPDNSCAYGGGSGASAVARRARALMGTAMALPSDVLTSQPGGRASTRFSSTSLSLPSYESRRGECAVFPSVVLGSWLRTEPISLNSLLRRSPAEYSLNHPKARRLGDSDDGGAGKQVRCAEGRDGPQQRPSPSPSPCLVLRVRFYIKPSFVVDSFRCALPISVRGPAQNPV